MNQVQNALEIAKLYAINEGFVTFHRGERTHGGQILARGLFVPAIDKHQHVRSRVLFLEKSAPAWFWDFARNCAFSGAEGKIFVRVCNIHADTVAFVRPILGVKKHALDEWERHKLDLHSQPVKLVDCFSHEERFTLLARAVARHHKATLVRCDSWTGEAHMVSDRGRYISIDEIDEFLKSKLLDENADLMSGTHPLLQKVRYTRCFDTTPKAA